MKLKPVTHEQAEKAALAFINSHFNNEGKERPQVGIPARETHDDDLLLMRYIREQKALDVLMVTSSEKEVAAQQLIAENPQDLGPYTQHCWDWENQRNYTKTVERIPSDEAIYERVMENKQKLIDNKLNGYVPAPKPNGDPTALFDGIITEMRRVYEETKPLKWWQRRPKYIDGSWWGDDNLMINLYNTAIENAKKAGFIR